MSNLENFGFVLVVLGCFFVIGVFQKLRIVYLPRGKAIGVMNVLIAFTSSLYPFVYTIAKS